MPIYFNNLIMAYITKNRIFPVPFRRRKSFPPKENGLNWSINFIDNDFVKKVTKILDRIIALVYFRHGFNRMPNGHSVGFGDGKERANGWKAFG